MKRLAQFSASGLTDIAIIHKADDGDAIKISQPILQKINIQNICWSNWAKIKLAGEHYTS